MAIQKPNTNGLMFDGLPDFDDNYVWVQEFDDEALRQFYGTFMKLEQNALVSVIPVIISSYGGLVSALVGMRDIIQSSTKPVATIALGKAMSCGAALLASGAKGLRFAGPHTEIMIHEISAGVEGKNADIQSDAANIARDNKIFLKNLATDMGMPLKALEKILHDRKNTDWHLSSDAAKKYGLIDHVSVPRIIQRQPQFELVSFGPQKKEPHKT